MRPARSSGYMGLLLSMAALAVLAGLLLFPGKAYAAEPAFNTGLSSTISVDENTASGTNIGSAYTATDGDSDTLTYSLSGTDMSSFGINMSTGQIKTSTALDYETNTSYSVTVGVSDSKDSTDMPDTVVDATMDVTINVTDVNEAPEIDSDATTATDFAEKGTGTVATYEATDPDASTTLTWSVEGDDEDDFTITKNSDEHGVLTFKNSPDYESAGDDDTNNVYPVTVNVCDSLDGDGGAVADDSIDLTVTVTNLAEAGTVTLSGMDREGMALTAALTDPDASTSNPLSSITWQWSRNDMSTGTFTDIAGEASSTL